jgi:hypothetical protein
LSDIPKTEEGGNNEMSDGGGRAEKMKRSKK